MLIGKPQIIIRVNNLKTTRENLLETLKHRYKILCKNTENSPIGLKILEKENQLSQLFKTPEFLHGEFDLQNEAAQLALLKIKPKKGERFLDFQCKLADKSLSLASMHEGLDFVLFEEKGRLLENCQNRFQKMRVSSCKFIDNFDQLKQFEKKFDWVLLDVPSSETGLLKERPESKLRFSPESFEALLRLQRRLLEESIRFLKPKTGKLVYFTNSLLKEV